MALYDHRAFRHQSNWWVAQVYGQGGGGWGEGPHPATDDFVLFTCLSREKQNSQSVHVPVGKLNSMSHASIVRFLEAAGDFPSRVEMAPHNTPDEAEYQGLDRITDDEQLRWVVRSQMLTKSVPTGGVPDVLLQVICLDDSALRRDVFLQASSTFDDFRQYMGADAGDQLVLAVKSTFEELWPDESLKGAARHRQRGI